MTVTIDKITDAEQYLDGLELAIFDLDDTLYSEKSYVRSGYDAIARAFPSVEDTSRKLWERFLRKEKAIDGVLEEEGLLTQENLQKCVEIYRYHAPNIRLYDGVLEMLLRIKSSGKKLGLITDGRVEGQRAKIKALGLEELFDEIVVTDELGGIEYRKPCEKAFLLVTERLGIEPSRSAYIGDNPKKDFIAPQKLGMRSVHFKNRDGLYYEP
jgi:putative hydrolase of the HAD superfamily